MLNSTKKMMTQKLLKIKEIPQLDVQKFIELWNLKYPYDRWWRKKYNVAFGSNQHREASFIEMVIEFKEDKFFQKLANKDAENSEIDSEVDRIIESEGGEQKSTPKLLKMNKKELDKEFDDMDLDEYNNKENE